MTTVREYRAAGVDAMRLLRQAETATTDRELARRFSRARLRLYHVNSCLCFLRPDLTLAHVYPGCRA